LYEKLNKDKESGVSLFILLVFYFFSIFFMVLYRLFAEQPSPQILCIFHAIFHILAIEDHYYEPSSFDLYTASQTGAGSICDAGFDTDIQV
jgi:hypothetical protein